MSNRTDLEREASSVQAQGGEAEQESGVSPRLAALQQRRWIQRKASRDAHASAEIPQSGGQPLDGNVRRSMERQLGADLSGVQVHTGGESANAARGLNARAFTVDRNVHFNSGEFAPGTKEGDRLLAHELTHVVQGQKSGIQRKAHEAEGGEAEAHDAHGGGKEDHVSEPGEPAEKEADAAADHVTDNLHGKGKGKGGEAEHGGAEKPSIGAAAPATARKIMRDGEKTPSIVAAAPSTARKIMRKPRLPGKPSERGNGSAGGLDDILRDMRVALVPGPFTRQREQFWTKKLDDEKANADKGGKPADVAKIGDARQEIKNAVVEADKKAAGVMNKLGGELGTLLKKLTPVGKEPVAVKSADAKKDKEKAFSFEVRQWIAEYQGHGPLVNDIKGNQIAAGEIDGKIASLEEAEKKPAPKEAGKPADASSAASGKPGDAGKPADAASAKPGDAASGKPADAASGNPADPAHAKPVDAASAKPGDAASAKPGDAAGAKPGAEAAPGKKEVFKPHIDPVVDPVGALREFIKAGMGWPDIKHAYGENEAQMTAMFHVRRAIVDPLLDAVCEKNHCKKEANGSANLTSDYDLSLSPCGPTGNPAQAVAEFNNSFRAQWGMESGTIFDTNVYDKGEAMTTKAGKQDDPKLKELEETKDFKQGNDRVQDVAALVKVRKYMNDNEWDGYKEQLLKTAPDDVKKKELQQRLLQAETQFKTNKKKLDDHVKLLLHLKPTDPMPAEVPDDVLLEAANEEYAVALKAVQAARKDRLDALKALQASPNDPTLKALVIEKDVAIRKAMASSLDFANEAYNSEGALIDVVGVQQGAFGAMGFKDPKSAEQLKLSPQEALSSFNEQFGDALKDLDHYGHSKEEPNEQKRFLKAMVQVSKYVLRMVEAGEQICGMNKEEKPNEQLMTEMTRLKVACGKMKDLRADPKLFAEKSETVPGTLNDKADGGARGKAAAGHTDEGAITPQAYGIDISNLEAFKGLLLRLNIDINQIARKIADVGKPQPPAGGQAVAAK